ncbi:hypothetical protein [Calothrix sp. 336/3]|uniref:hypothetical protein n=1 Tax=Calothrix sp. 336/3 TaxID=1337936 RepID=UPI0004E3F74C|nr:hypothetical protein [Calothrix sp. 336/3]AKG19983.1 hypothetical protein IJ00_00435 [Calothrix sp. 336/3]
MKIHHPKFLSSPWFHLTSVIFAGTIVFLTSRAIAQNAVLRSMFSCQAQGFSGIVPTIKVWYQQGTNLSFLPAGEIIKKVWLNDPSQVIIDFDGEVCQQFGQGGNANSNDCKSSGANVIQLRRISKIKIPGIPHTSNSLLTVITEGQGKTKLYTFRIIYDDGIPDYHTLAIYPDPPSATNPPCVRK